MTPRALTFVSGALAIGGLAIGALLWHGRWPALAVEFVLRLCG